jgi:hypothetical protein
MGYCDRLGETGAAAEAAERMPQPATTLNQWIAVPRL